VIQKSAFHNGLVTNNARTLRLSKQSGKNANLRHILLSKNSPQQRSTFSVNYKIPSFAILRKQKSEGSRQNKAKSFNYVNSTKAVNFDQASEGRVDLPIDAHIFINETATREVKAFLKKSNTFASAEDLRENIVSHGRTTHRHIEPVKSDFFQEADNPFSQASRANQVLSGEVPSFKHPST